MSLLTVDEAQAGGIGADLTTEALQAAIDEEEAWLARRIGPLTGERTERFPLAALRPQSSEIRLARPIDADGATLTIGGLELDEDAFEVRPGGWRIALLPEATRIGGITEVKYEPNDELEVKRALRELLAITLASQRAGGLQSEQIGSYSYQRAPGGSSRGRRSILRGLREPLEPSSMRVHSSVRHGLAGALGR